MSIKKLVLPVDILENLIRDAKTLGRKEEIAGVFLGKINGETAIVIESKRGENILHDKSSFLLDPEQFYKFLIEGEKKGLELVGVWHTHLGDPNPSIIDVKTMMMWPIVWVIFDAITGIFTASKYDVETEKIVSVKVELRK